MKKMHRAAAALGAALIVVSLAAMMAGMFLPAYKELLLNVSLWSFLAALGILVLLKAVQRRMAEEKAGDQTEQDDQPEDN